MFYTVDNDRLKAWIREYCKHSVRYAELFLFPREIQVVIMKYSYLKQQFINLTVLQRKRDY